MEKVTNRILWSILLLSIGVSLFVFDKPALVNLTNQALHHDDLKATMQTPSLTSSDLVRISAVNNDVGVSKHAYILSSTKGFSDDGCVLFPKEIRQTPIPYNSYVKLIFKVKVDKPVRMILDVNNHPATGNTWGGNDNDSYFKRVFLLDNNSIASENPGLGSGNLSAGTWHTIDMEYENTAGANTQHVALFDDSVIDFHNDNLSDFNVQIKDFVFAVDDVKYR